MAGSDKITIGVIGAGYWGPNHLRIFSAQPDSEVLFCAEKDEEKRNRLSAQFDRVQFVDDYAPILASDKVDAVVIATSTDTHYRITKEALEAGKDVLCEKPLSLEAVQAFELVDIAEAQQRILMVGNTFLFNNGILAMRDILNNGDLGRSHYLHSVRTNLGPIRADVNVVYDLASHDVAIFNFLLNSQPSQVVASGMNYLQGSIEDVAFLTLYYPDNILAHCHVSWLHPKKMRELTIVGDRKMATWNDLSQTGPVTIFSKTVDSDPYYTDFGQFHLLVREGDINVPYVPMREPLREQAVAFLEAVRIREVPVSDGRFSAEVVAVLEAANKSIRANGKAIEVKT